MKSIRVLLLALLCAVAMPTFAQLTIGTVDPGPYTPGSSIAATFSIDPDLCVAQNNVFSLRLSDAAGNFSNNPATIIGTYNAFYGTFVNGIIPENIPLGNGYKVRIESSAPALLTAESNPFAIVSGGAIESKLISSKTLCGNAAAFGFSVGQIGANANIDLVNQSTAGGFVTTTVTNEANGTISTINFITQQQNFEAELTHYTLFVKNEMPNGNVATKAYFIINNRVNTSFTTSGSAYVCLPGGSLQYFIDVTSLNTGIQNNFPGNTYKINWGDDTENIYTFCTLKSGVVEHNYLKSSCGEVYRAGNTTIYNAFGINVQVVSPFCGNVGTGVSTTAKVVDITQNSFNGLNQTCKNTPTSFVNTSILGDDPENTGPSCRPDNARFNWYVDGVLQASDQPRSFVFSYTFTQSKIYTVKLESIGTTGCATKPFEQQICVQDAPEPQFNFAQNTVCGPTTLKPTNTSVLDQNCQAGVSYLWTVTPTVGFANNTNATSPEPEFIFNPGNYQVQLAITTASCGTVNSAPQTIVVNSAPTVVLSPDINLCNLAAYDFSNSTTGPTRTVIEGTFTDLTDSYTWTVSSTGNYTFTNGTNKNSKYPRIEFSDYTDYTVTLVHQNNCGTVTASQKLTFTPAPEVNAGPDQSICFDVSAVTLNGAINGSTLTSEWLGGEGVFTPSRNDLNATYQPSAAERTNGSVALTLSATTNLANPCNEITDEVVIIIKPEVTVNSTNTTVICTGQSVNYTPTSATAGTTFTWTVLNATNATGYANSGTGTITDVVTNIDPNANGTITYIITPTGNGCTGTPFTLTVTVAQQSVGGTTAGDTNVCAGNNSGQILLTDHIGNVMRWESSTDGGLTYPTIINNNTTTLTYSNLSTTTYFRAVVQNGICTETVSTPSIITVNPLTTTANAGANQTLCNATTTILAANQPNANETGLWTVEPTNPSITFADATQYNTTVNGLTGGQTYTFRWTISGLAPCSPTSDDVIVNNLSALLNNNITSPSTTFCTGQTITLTGSTPTGGNGSYNYIWESSIDGNAPWTAIAGQTAKDLNVVVNATQSYRRIVNSGACNNESNSITIIALPPIANNTISANHAICLGSTPNIITGSQPTGGNGINYTYSWEQSTDNGANWASIPNEFSASFSPSAITQTTLYRRLVSSGICDGSLRSISNNVTITVNLNAKAEFTWISDVGCVPFNIDANNISTIPYPSQNATYIWYANDVEIGRGITFPGYEIATTNTSVTIKLVTTSSLGCLPDEMSHTFSTRQDVMAAFTQSASSGCGPLNVTFTNTSTMVTGVTFEWSVDDNVFSDADDLVNFQFLADPAGEDKEYTITLKAITPCGSTSTSSTVKVIANPIAAFLPSTTIGCSPLTVVFTNTSPGNSNTYSYDFGDGTTSPETTSKATVTHTFTTDVVRDFEVKMTTKNECGTDTKPIIIRVSPNNIIPALIVNGNQLRGCAPHTVNFINNTNGASKFTYTFEPGVEVTSNTFLPETRPYTFTRPGTYTVSLLAENDCSTATAAVTIVVDPQPTVSFTATNLEGCEGLSVNFTNNTTNAVSYKWDFGDGETSNEINPTHVYNAPPGLYTVSLTAVNDLGCPTTFTIPNYISIVAPPNANFDISPAAVISIPDYTFKFFDASTNTSGTTTYKWSFGDGAESTLRDPTHLYADTGKYIVTMRTYNEFGCVDSLQKTVQITGVPGYLFLPNSFMPGGTSSPLQKFTAIGSGIKSWRMQVFNKWGQTIWQTTQLDDGKPIEGWDGTYKGVPQPQGVYFWKVDVELINGSEWKGMSYDKKAPKRTGEIYLIR